MRGTAITPARFAHLLETGRGQGRGAGYVPWLFATEVASMGEASEVHGRISGRVHQLLSGNERTAFHLLDRCPDVRDIREGMPLLPVEFTWDLARELNLRVPLRDRTRFHVMTTDFLVDLADGRKIAIAVKSEQQLVGPPTEESKPVDEPSPSSRVGELLAIEKAYWSELRIDFRIWTDQVLTREMRYTLDALYTHRCLPEGMDEEIVQACHARLQEVLRKRRSTPLAELCLALDRRCGLGDVTHYSALMHLAYRGDVGLDLKRRFSESEPHYLRNGVLIADVRRPA